MSDEKKDLNSPSINYRNDWVEKHGERKEAANEKSNQAQGKKVERVRDADGGSVKSPDEHLQEGKEREGKTFRDRMGQDRSPSAGRSGSGGRGGASIVKEPDEMLKEKNDAVNPEEPLSQKGGKKSSGVALNTDANLMPEQKKQEHQQQQGKYQSRIAETFKASAIRRATDELSVSSIDSEKALATLKAVTNKQANPEKSTKLPVGKEKNIQIAENKIKTQAPKGIKR